MSNGNFEMKNTNNEELMQSELNLAINNESSPEQVITEKKETRIYADEKEKEEMREVNPRAIQ